jgi:MOSC domain-containing protein YiiM
MNHSTLVAINIARSRPVPWGQMKRSAIDKRPVSGPVHIHQLGVDGDEQADLKHHGGIDQAVYAFAREDAELWERELGRELPCGSFGENLSTRGLDVTGAVIGERWRMGRALFEVSSPRIPCSVFAGFMGEPHWINRFTARARPGAYLRVLEEGMVTAGDAIELVHRPAHGVTIGEVFRAKSGEAELIPKLLLAPELKRTFREWARARVDAQ